MAVNEQGMPATKKRPDPLQRIKARELKHDEILSRTGKSVKTDWLTDFRVRHQLKGTEIVEAIRSLYPGFDKSLLSKVSSPEKYGICLAPEAIRLLKTMFEGEKDDGTA